MSKTLRSQMNPTMFRSTAPTTRAIPVGSVHSGSQVLRVDDRRITAASPKGSSPRKPGRQPAFGGEGADLPAHPLALGDGVGHRVEQLGQVASDLTLDADRQHDPREVGALHPVGHVVERILDAAGRDGSR